MPKYKHGSGSVYQRGKTWWVTYYVNGKQVWESAGTKDKAEARRILQARLGQIAEGRYVGPATDKVTCDALIALVTADYHANRKKSLDMVGIRWKKHLAPYFAGRTAQSIKTADVTAYAATRQEKGASNAEINRELALLRRGYSLALKAEMIFRKPHFAMLKESAPRQEFFSEEEYPRLLAKMPEELKAPLAFAFTMGWRIKSEVLSLTWERVDMAEGAVTLLTGTTKNGKGRVIYLPDELKAMLEHQHQTRPAECPWVFHRGGKRIKDFRGAWDTACQEAFLRGKVPHDLRRSAVRNLVRAGIPETVAMKVTGHADRSVFERYNIVSPGDLRHVAKVLSQRDTLVNNDNRFSVQSVQALSS